MEQKRLTLSEYDAIVAFDRLCFPQDHWTEEDWRELLADERAVYLALLDDGRIVGDVFVYNWQGERDYGKIMNLAVHPGTAGAGWRQDFCARRRSCCRRPGCRGSAARHVSRMRPCAAHSPPAATG